MRATVTSFAGPAQGSEIPTCRPPVCEDSESRAESRAAQSVRLALPGPAEPIVRSLRTLRTSIMSPSRTLSHRDKGARHWWYGYMIMMPPNCAAIVIIAESSDWESESAPGRESQSHGPGIMSHDSLAAEVHVKILTFQVTSHQ
jgi:hypothetical protein